MTKSKIIIEAIKSTTLESLINKNKQARIISDTIANSSEYILDYTLSEYSVEGGNSSWVSVVWVKGNFRLELRFKPTDNYYRLDGFHTETGQNFLLKNLSDLKLFLAKN